MSDKTCSNPICGCTSLDGEGFCSADCEVAEATAGTICNCGHTECQQAKEALAAG